MHIAARTVPRSLLLTITFALLLLADARSAVTALPTSAPAAQAPSCQNPAPFVTANSDGGLPAATVAALGGLGASIASSAASLPGLSVAVVVDQQIDFAAGFGCADIANSVAATPQTVYRIESVTKVFEATAMMQQRDAPSVPGNAFTLQTTVDTLVPPVYYSLQNSQRYSPTFQELASHTAGLPDDPGGGYATLDVFWQHLEGTTATNAPGIYSYSDLGFITLGQSVALIAGLQPPDAYHGYISQAILQPLGMSSSSYDVSAVPAGQLAVPYKAGSGTQRWVADPSANQSSISFAGDIFSSVQDMAQIVMLQSRTGPVGGSQILACSSVQEMWQPVGTVQGGGYSTIGWFVQNYNTPTETISKNGGAESWAALVRYMPNVRLGVVALTNTGTGVGPTLASLESKILGTLAPTLPSNRPACSGS